MALQRLPEEILAHIFAYVAAETSVYLLPVCETSSRLRETAQKFVSRHLLIDEWKWEHTTEVAQHFLRSPSSRDQIKNLTIRSFVRTRSKSLDSRASLEEDEHVPLRLSEREGELLAQSAEECFPQMESLCQWKDQLSKGVHDAFYALLIVWAARLETLEIPAYPAWDDMTLETSFISQVVRQLMRYDIKVQASRELPLCSLRALRLIEGYSIGCDFPCQALIAAPFFYLPRLRSFRTSPGYGINWEISPDGVVPFPKRTSSVVEVYLDGWVCDETGFEQIIIACESLRRLYITDDQVEDSFRLSLEPILVHRDTLEELIIAARGRTTHAVVGNPLKEFTRLRRLEMGIWNLTQDVRSVPILDLLPHSLECMFLEGATVDQLRALAIECGENGRFTNMRRIEYSRNLLENQSDESLRAFQSLETSCHLQGLNFVGNDLEDLDDWIEHLRDSL
jgi:hypothetical protein